MSKWVWIFSFIAVTVSANAEIHRSTSARNAFKRLHPCPATQQPKGPCPGYVIDHIKPLACKGPDTPANMQWQTVAEGKAKDKWERKECESTNGPARP